ncbi:hypothetical protein GN956_G24979 [Arapaima gigas]
MVSRKTPHLNKSEFTKESRVFRELIVTSDGDGWVSEAAPGTDREVEAPAEACSLSTGEQQVALSIPAGRGASDSARLSLHGGDMRCTKQVPWGSTITIRSNGDGTKRRSTVDCLVMAENL